MTDEELKEKIRKVWFESYLRYLDKVINDNKVLADDNKM